VLVVVSIRCVSGSAQWGKKLHKLDGRLGRLGRYFLSRPNMGKSSIWLWDWFGKLVLLVIELYLLFAWGYCLLGKLPARFDIATIVII
jgi:hypothetical protein